MVETHFVGQHSSSSSSSSRAGHTWQLSSNADATTAAVKKKHSSHVEIPGPVLWNVKSGTTF